MFYFSFNFLLPCLPFSGLQGVLDPIAGEAGRGYTLDKSPGILQGYIKTKTNNYSHSKLQRMYSYSYSYMEYVEC